ncbi:MAG: hypothetical protein FJ340_06485 [Sphingomonadales bacterium]|nr:hypothetical protein [Sphingomonadales bacterium]
MADASVTDAKIVTVSGSKVTGNITGNAANVTGTVAVANGGTGATTATAARTNLGLGNVDNTSDLAKPISTATQTALDLKENASNKSTATSLGTSDVLYPTQNAVKTYVDAQLASGSTPDATASIKGKLQLAGDLTGTASSPSVAAGAITTSKIADAAVTDAKIASVSGSKVSGNITGNAANVTGTVAVANGGTGQTTINGVKTILGLNGTTVAIASEAGLTNQGNNGIAIGAEAGKNNQNVNAIAIGAGAGRTNQGLAAISIGYVSGDVSQGVNAIAIGGNTAQANQADQTVAIGYAAGQYNQGTNAVAIGAFAGNNGQVANSIAINASGPSSPLNPTNAGLYISPIRTASAISNVLYYDPSSKEVTYGTSTGVTTVGSIAGSSNVNGATISGNTIALAPASLTNGGIVTTSAQTFSGSKTFSSDITVNGVKVGRGAGNNGQNIAIGADALASGTGTRNTAVGYGAMRQYNGTSFDNNTSIGYWNMSALTSGNGNTSVGAESMLSITTGTQNTSIGNQSLISTTGNDNVGVGKRSGETNTTGSQNTFIGTNSNAGSNNLSNATALGYGATVATSNTIQLGNSNISNVKTSGTLTAGVVTYPNTDGTANQVLKTNGSGTLSWSTPVVGAATGINNDITQLNGLTNQKLITQIAGPINTSSYSAGDVVYDQSSATYYFFKSQLPQSSSSYSNPTSSFAIFDFGRVVIRMRPDRSNSIASITLKVNGITNGVLSMYSALGANDPACHIWNNPVVAVDAATLMRSSSPTSGSGYVTFTFGTPISVTANTDYYLTFSSACGSGNIEVVSNATEANFAISYGTTSINQGIPAVRINYNTYGVTSVTL